MSVENVIKSVTIRKDENNGAGLRAVFLGDMPLHHFGDTHKPEHYARKLREQIQKQGSQTVASLTVSKTANGGSIPSSPAKFTRMHVGWMDSIGFDHELGNRPAGSAVFPSKEDCEKNHPCIKESQELDDDIKCYAKRVYVVDADAFDLFLENVRNKVAMVQGPSTIGSQPVDAGSIPAGDTSS